MKKWLKKKFNNERGLTLVELLAVIVILAIVAVIAFVMIGNIVDNSRKDAHVANAQQIIAAAKLYDASEKEIDENDGIEVSKIQDAGYLDKEILDPWEKVPYETEAKVYKSDSSYSISGFTASKCKGQFEDEVTEQELAKEGRELCNDSNDGNGGNDSNDGNGGNDSNDGNDG